MSIITSCKASEQQEQLDRIESEIYRLKDMLRYLFDNSKACYHNQPLPPKPDITNHLND